MEPDNTSRPGLCLSAWLRSVLGMLPDPVVLVGDDASIQALNPAAERLFGHGAGEMMGRDIGVLIPSTDHALPDAGFVRAGPGGERQVMDGGRFTTGLKGNGTVFPIEFTVGQVEHCLPPVFAVFVRDLTERQASQAKLRALQEDLVHVSRLRAMGQMAAALSHELNQPLTATTNYLNAASRLMNAEAPDLARIRQAIMLAMQQTMRSGEIIRRLRAFMARGEVVRQPEAIGRIVEDASALALVGVKKHGVSVMLETGLDLPQVLVDRVQIQQVLLNLLRNAVEAMEGSPERLVSVQAGLWDSMVVVSVCDTGSGISPAIEAQLFQPFVTTKRNGMGVGLSVCRTIVEAHGGRLWTEPNPVGGTIFRFTLPLAQEPG